MDNLLFIDTKIMFFSDYNIDNDSFFTDAETIHDSISQSMKDFLYNIKNKMKPWQKNFFISAINENSFTYCPGPNIENIVFSDGLSNVSKTKLDLYILEWLFSVAMGIYIMQTQDIEYLGLSDRTILIDSKMHARIINMSHNFYQNDTTTAYPIFFYSPEKCMQYISNEGEIILDTEQKNKSDVYSYGVFMHELVTRMKHSSTYFNNLPKFHTISKLQSGAIDYMNLEQRDDIPFHDLLCLCLKKDYNERCGIEYVIERLLNIEKDRGINNRSNQNYLDINSVDLDKYHRFIIEICGFKNIGFQEAKNRIIAMLQTKSDPLTDNIEVKNLCSFEDLEKGYKKGLRYCYETIQKCYEKMYANNQVLYKKFCQENPEISEFSVMKTFYRSRFILPILLEELNKLRAKHNNQFIEFPSGGEIDKRKSLFNFLHGNSFQNEVDIETKIKWLNSIALQLKVLQRNNNYVLNFSSKEVYLNDKMEAFLYLPKVLQFGQKNDKNQYFSDELHERMSLKNEDDISIFYRPPELLQKNIHPEKIQFEKCALYSLGVLAKELLEYNTPWLLTQNLSKKEKMKVLKNPTWRHFSVEELNNDKIKKEEKEMFLISLFQSLKKDPNQRVNIDDVVNNLQPIINSFSME